MIFRLFLLTILSIMSHYIYATDSKIITFTTPDKTASEVHWDAIPLPGNKFSDVWAPHETSPSIKAVLSHGPWLVTGRSANGKHFSAEITVTKSWPDNLTLVLPELRLPAEESYATSPHLIERTKALISRIKSLYLLLQSQQANSKQLNSLKHDIETFIVIANRQLGDNDYYEIETLLSLMGKSFNDTYHIWQRSKKSLLTPQTDDTDEPEVDPGNGEDVALVCQSKKVCHYKNEEFQLDLLVPNGWALSYPYFYETAAGTKSRKATVLYIRLKDDVMISLNERMASGKCQDTQSGRLCYYSESNISNDELDTIVRGAN